MPSPFELKTRTVSIQYTTSPLGSGPLVLPGVQSVRVSFETPIAEAMGLQVAFLQSWFLKPVEVTIQGKQYIGAYANQKIVQAMQPGKDVTNALSIIDVLQNNSATVTSGLSPEAILTFGGISGNEATIKLQGFISRFDYTEQVDRPYIIDYTLTFKGIDPNATVIANALNLSVADRALPSALNAPADAVANAYKSTQTAQTADAIVKAKQAQQAALLAPEATPLPRLPTTSISPRQEAQPLPAPVPTGTIPTTPSTEAYPSEVRVPQSGDRAAAAFNRQDQEATLRAAENKAAMVNMAQTGVSAAGVQANILGALGG